MDTKLNYSIQFILVLVIAIFLGGCGGSGDESSTPLATETWTVLVYIAADNDLASYAVRNFNQMEEVGSTPLMNVIVQIDLPSQGTSSLPSEAQWTGCRRYRVEHDTDPQSINSTLLMDLGEVNMADATTLGNFLSWGKSAYPADRYLVVLWGHGDDWSNETMRALSIFNDWSSGKPQFLLPNYEVRQAVEGSGLHPDILAFDACAMGGIEAAYEFRDLADIMVSSQELVWEDGFPYDEILSALVSDRGMTPEGLSHAMVSAFGHYYTSEQSRLEQCLSALRLGKIDAIATALDDFAKILVDGIQNTSLNDPVSTSRQESESFTVIASKYVDLLDFARRLKGQAVVDATQLESSISSAIVDNFHRAEGEWGHPNANGLSVYFPLNKSLYEEDPSYDNYNPTTGTGSPSEFMKFNWDEFLKAYFSLMPSTISGAVSLSKS